MSLKSNSEVYNRNCIVNIMQKKKKKNIANIYFFKYQNVFV